jgi:hypothetical protein
MKIKHFTIGLIITFAFPLSAFAISAPTVDSVLSQMDADTYNLIIHTEPGAKISVVGGPGQLAPMTDGIDDDIEDGVVEFTVGLVQNEENIFSITAEKDSDISDSVTITINEVSAGGGDTNLPNAPSLKPIPEVVDTAQYIITGNAEPNTNIYVKDTEGNVVGSTHSSSNTGLFQVTVELEENTTNRFNVSAEYVDGGEGPAVQAVIRQSVDLPEEEVEPKPELILSAQIFFEDIEGHWAEAYIEQLYEEDVVSGKSEGIFDPNGNITRAELTKIAMLAFGYSVNVNVDEHPFSDVPRNSWFAPYVEEAKRAEIIEGYPTGGFGPNDFITRAAALKIILGAAEINASGSVPDFPDVPANEWYAPYVGYAQENNIVSGYPDGTFGPGNFITRAQVAKIVVKVLEMQ